MVQRTILNMHSWVIDSDFESKLFSIKTTKGHSSGEVWAVLKYPSISISIDIYPIFEAVKDFLTKADLMQKVWAWVRGPSGSICPGHTVKSFTYCIAEIRLCQTDACQIDNHQVVIYIRNKIITSHNRAVNWTSLMITKRRFYSGYIRLT